ncbi:MAG: ABC transporter ATP-binding protein [Thioalkalispiraceae bacterium]|jgi:iron complex transport system ATP-binding protein
MTGTPLLQTRQLAVSVADKPICRHLELSVQRGECWAILGQNGSGKTTLLHSLAGLRDVDNGQVVLNARPLEQLSARHTAQQCGLLLQDYQDVFPASVMQTVLIGRHPHLSNWQWESGDDYQLADAALADVELDGMQHRLLQTLSGGERRRVAIATLLAQQPDLFLLDEPVNHLDIKHQQLVLELFAQKARTGKHAVMMVLHDINLAARYCSHVLMLHGNEKVEFGRCEEMLSAEKLSALYDYPIQQLGGKLLFTPG